MVHIRRYTGRGSTVTDYVLKEAEAVAQDAWQRKCLVVDEATHTPLLQGTALVDKAIYTLVPPIAGG